MLTPTKKVLLPLQKTIARLVKEFDQITVDRKRVIMELTTFIIEKAKSNQHIKLNFICTHNSRRSHISQIWAQVAAYYFGVELVETFSGGTEATAFNIRAVDAMKQAGFQITTNKEGSNPLYDVRYSEGAPRIQVFSKKYDDPFNPGSEFAAIMTCSHADEKCPLIVGASKRIALTYNDPKDYDGTPQESEKYTERVHEIGREILYAFSQVK